MKDATRPQPRPRPNILVVMTEDHGQWATGCYGNRELRTPTLDYRVRTGTRIANAFTPTPVCSPTRASFFYRASPLAERMPEVGERNWLADETTLPQLLSAARRYPDGPCELFDLTIDPRETVNLFNDAAHQACVQQLAARLDAHFAR